MIILRMTINGEITMSDEFILDDVIETFSDEDTLLSDIQNNPGKVDFVSGNYCPRYGLYNVW